MSVVRRGSAVSVAGVAVAGAVLLGGPAWAQEVPPDYDPAIAESGLPASDTGTVDIDPDTPVDDGSCTVVVDGTSGDESTDSAEPDPGAADETVPAEDGTETTPDESAGDAGAAEDTAVDDTAADGTAVDDSTADGSAEPTDEVVVCAAASGGAVGSTGGGGGLEVDAAELPRTGSSDRLLALTAVGAGLVIAGAGATAAGRRRRA